MNRALSHPRQRGAVLVLVTIALFVLLAFTALALDGGYLVLNKTRVQDAVDSAALSGAETLDKGGTHSDAEAAVGDALTAIFKGDGFTKVNVDTDNLDSVVTVEFSDVPVPFTAGSTTGKYIRVTMNTVPVAQFFSQLLVDTWQVGASAIAGASPSISNSCQIIPLLMCGGDLDNKDKPEYTFGFTPSTDTERGDVLVIKTPNHPDAGVGPGNFLGVDLDEMGGGANEYGLALAGQAHNAQCVAPGDEIITLPGNKVGPTDTGLNTRFGEYQNGNGKYSEPLDDPADADSDAFYADCGVPDYNSTGLELLEYGELELASSGGSKTLTNSAQLDKLQSYPDYLKDIKSAAPNTQHCLKKRRLVRVPVANCTGHDPGKSFLTSLGTACVFLSQKVVADADKDKGKGPGNKQFIVAEFVKNCTADGVGNSNLNNGPYRLVLFKNSAGGDS